MGLTSIGKKVPQKVFTKVNEDRFYYVNFPVSLFGSSHEALSSVEHRSTGSFIARTMNGVFDLYFFVSLSTLYYS